MEAVFYNCTREYILDTIGFFSDSRNPLTFPLHLPLPAFLQCFFVATVTSNDFSLGENVSMGVNQSVSRTLSELKTRSSKGTRAYGMSWKRFARPPISTSSGQQFSRPLGSTVILHLHSVAKGDPDCSTCLRCKIGLFSGNVSRFDNSCLALPLEYCFYMDESRSKKNRFRENGT